MATTADSATPEQGPAPDGAQHADIAGLTYEQARDELVDIVARLENGQSGLEESMGLWQRGEALAAHCATWLDRAEAKITAQE
ncbi:MAG TPA: exodeoxyribonuclease VII small subunit [Ornithinibacter sp.]|jgi:exodeoxyribonuclease VII small subunit|nr:exodeoxyribonuclease VII small subunit [Ornithinibacter sp.]HPV90745.1 exodeoxyribonuclease VII small subunit [Ornithinibacter sp.]HQD68293.1 exodeoxyribonuclease VII small subunit [Ornithinibacter sp.]